jgi:mRNA interferase RelE/StbE
MYQVIIVRSAEKDIERLSSTVIKRIFPVLENLAVKPRPAGSKKLTGQKENLWRVRVGDYRIVYLIEDKIKIVEVRRVGHRKDIYQ